MTTPEGYSLERTGALLAELEGRIWQLRGTRHVFTTIGQTSGGRSVKGQGDVTRGTIFVRMKDLENRNYTQFVVQEKARQVLGAENHRVLSQRDARRFLELLDAEAAPNEALSKAAERYRARDG